MRSYTRRLPPELGWGCITTSFIGIQPHYYSYISIPPENQIVVISPLPYQRQTARFPKQTKTQKCTLNSPIIARSEIPTLTNATNIKHARLLNPLPLKRLPQQLRRLQHILLCQHPRAPMHRHGASAPRIRKDLHAIKRIRMHTAKQMPRVIRPYRDQAQVKRPLTRPDLLERRAARQVRVFGAVVVDTRRQVGDSPVSRVAAEPDGFAAGDERPGGPERVRLVEGGARRGVLAGEAGDARCDRVVWDCGQRGGGRGGGGKDPFLTRLRGEGHVDILPPVELDDVGDSAVVEPLFEP